MYLLNTLLGSFFTSSVFSLSALSSAKSFCEIKSFTSRTEVTFPSFGFGLAVSRSNAPAMLFSIKALCLLSAHCDSIILINFLASLVLKPLQRLRVVILLSGLDDGRCASAMRTDDYWMVIKRLCYACFFSGSAWCLRACPCVNQIWRLCKISSGGGLEQQKVSVFVLIPCFCAVSVRT